MPVPDQAQRTRLHNETGAFIYGIRRWRSFAHFTFEHPVSRDDARRKFQDWIRRLARDVVGTHLTVAWSIERGLLGGLVHIHALLHVHANKTTPFTEVLERDWPHGIAAVQDYDDRRRGAWYLVGDIEWSGDADWSIDVACDRGNKCRRSTCLEERSLTVSGYYAATQVHRKNGLPSAGLAPGAAV
jgi:hypothetical protein